MLQWRDMKHNGFITLAVSLLGHFILNVSYVDVFYIHRGCLSVAALCGPTVGIESYCPVDTVRSRVKKQKDNKMTLNIIA